MFENINDLCVQGGIFTRESELKHLVENPLNLLYGANGSGKSTIARALAAAAENKESDLHVRFDSSEITPEMAPHIHVFNEDFIDKNIRFRTDGVETITMFGSAAVAVDETEAIRSYIDQKKRELQEAEVSLADLLTSGQHLKDSYKKQLQLGYCVRYQQIKDLKNPKQLRDEDYPKIENATKDANWPAKRAALQADFDEKVNRMASSREGEHISWARPMFPHKEVLTRVDALLRKVIKKPELSEQDLHLLDIATHEMHYLTEARTRLVDQEAEFCPLCHQPLTSNYRAQLLERINTILNTEAEGFRVEINDAIRDLKQFYWIGINNLPQSLWTQHQAAYEHYESLRDIIEDLLARLDEKLNSLYIALPGIDVAVEDHDFEEYDALLRQLEIGVNQHNRDVDNTKVLTNELLSMNQYLAKLETADVHSDLVAKREEYAAIGRKKKAIENDIDAKKEQLNSLLASTQNVGEAMELINLFLTQIFCNKRRLLLRANDDSTYKLLVRESDVTPDKISVGERNILALAYFFASLCKNKDRNSLYSDEMLVVIDDPISSFDDGNRAGIMSLLISELFKIMKANRNSKVLVMSHDLATIMDLQSQWQYDGAGVYVQRHPGLERDSAKEMVRKFVFYELSSLTLHENKGYTNHYELLVRSIFDYGFKFASDGLRAEFSRGNAIRRFLEQYASFMYGKDSYSMLSDKNLLDKIPDDNLKAAIIGRPVRLVANTESHGVQATRVTNFNAEPIYQQEDIRKIAQSIIWFVFYTNRDHLESYLKRDQWQILLDFLDQNNYFPERNARY